MSESSRQMHNIIKSSSQQLRFLVAIVAYGAISLNLYAADSETIDRLVAALYNPAKQILAAKTLGELGTQAAPASNELISILEQSFFHKGQFETEFITEVEQAIVSIGPSSIPVILANLDSRNSDHGPPINLIRLLRHYNQDGVTALIQVLEHKDHHARRAALNCLPRLKQAAKPALPHIVKRLKSDPNLSVRLTAVRVLKNLARHGGVFREIALEEILKASRSNAPLLQKSAAAAILRIESGNESSKAIASLLPTLREWLEHPDEDIRLAGAKHLASRSDLPAAAIDNLTEAMLKDSSLAVRLTAAQGLSNNHSSEEKVIKSFLASLGDNQQSDTHSSVSEIAVDSLWRTGKPVLPRLIQKLSNNEPAVRFAAAITVVKIDPRVASQETIAILLDALKRNASSHHIVSTASSALGTIGDAAKEAIPTLMVLFNELETNRYPSKRSIHTAILLIDPTHPLSDESLLLDEFAGEVNSMLSGQTFREQKANGQSAMNVRHSYTKFTLAVGKDKPMYVGRDHRRVTTENTDGTITEKEEVAILRLHQNGRSLLLTQVLLDGSATLLKESTFVVKLAQYTDLRIELEPNARKSAKPGDLRGVHWMHMKAGRTGHWSYLDVPSTAISAPPKLTPNTSCSEGH